MINILHLASFQGNIGDNASHIGLRSILKSILKEPFRMQKLEIRKFYNNYVLPDKRFFDRDFAELVNQYDLLIIGGGNFFEYSIANSSTATTINLGKDILKLIHTPILISSMGCTIKEKVSQSNRNKFQEFLNTLFSEPKIALTLRNDGSKNYIKEDFGDEYSDRIPQVLDNGFFYTNSDDSFVPCEGEYITINTALDQVGRVNRGIDNVDSERYVNEMVKVINHVLVHTNLNIVFTKHIYSDSIAIDSILKYVNDFHLRTRIYTSPYSHGDFGANQVFSIYKNSRLNIGMRFHANVCSLAMRRPTIGLAALDRVVEVYQDIGLREDIVKLDYAFSETLIALISDCLLAEPKDELNNRIEELKIETLQVYNKALREIGLMK